jgi:hypothetical protein
VLRFHQSGPHLDEVGTIDHYKPLWNASGNSLACGPGSVPIFQAAGVVQAPSSPRSAISGPICGWAARTYRFMPEVEPHETLTGRRYPVFFLC